MPFMKTSLRVVGSTLTAGAVIGGFAWLKGWAQAADAEIKVNTDKAIAYVCRETAATGADRFEGGANIFADDRSIRCTRPDGQQVDVLVTNFASVRQMHGLPDYR
jgi:hypothetical protein